MIYTRSTLATPPIYNQANLKYLAPASPGNSMVVTKPSLLLFFVQQEEKCLELLTSLEKTYVLTTFGKKIHEKSSVEVKTCNKTHCCTL